jgi:hypothetical protein
MAFADLKNDFVFRRIFATHPDILRGLLNDLLERTGDQTIDAIEYLPSEQLPLVTGAKLSILDVRCQDRAGTKFVVEMQLPKLANEATFTQGELDAYRKVMDEIQQEREYGAAQRAEGLNEGEIRGRREALLRLLARAKLDLADSDRARIQTGSDVETLNRWIENVIGASSVSDVLA